MPRACRTVNDTGTVETVTTIKLTWKGIVRTVSRSYVSDKEIVRQYWPPEEGPEPPTPTGTNFYVAPDGDDSNPGTLEEPFASLEAAQQAVQAEKAANGMGEGITVILREGTWQL